MKRFLTILIGVPLLIAFLGIGSALIDSKTDKDTAIANGWTENQAYPNFFRTTKKAESITLFTLKNTEPVEVKIEKWSGNGSEVFIYFEDGNIEKHDTRDIVIIGDLKGDK